ncbi:MAG: DUF3577 domain-containing protein, partial [Aquisalimonadaceae bacterium]
MLSPNVMQGQSTMSQYFDLHIQGIGYVNRVRTVSPRKGQPFVACDIVALHGSSEAPEKTRSIAVSPVQTPCATRHIGNDGYRRHGLHLWAFGGRSRCPGESVIVWTNVSGLSQGSSRGR